MAKAPQKALPKDLVEQAARGHCVALIGPSTDLDAQRATFVETLARDCAYPPDKSDRSLPAVAYYYQGMRDRQQLIARLREWTDQVEQSPAPLLSSLAASPFTRFVDFAHDARLQFALLSEETKTSRWEAEGVTPLIAPDPVQWLATLQQEVAALPPAPQDLMPVDGPLLGRRPYKFLDYYTAQDADLFFGRQAWIEQLTARILAQPLTVLFGRSGVGKTSLLQAGLMPCLRSQGCLPIYSRPEADPVAEIWKAVSYQHATLDSQSASLATVLSGLAQREARTMLILLDQLEEVFTLLGEDTFRLERYRILGGALAQGLPDAVVGTCVGVGLALGEWLSRPMADSKSQIADGEGRMAA